MQRSARHAHWAEVTTDLGNCTIAWTPHGVCAFQLPAADSDAARRTLQNKLGVYTHLSLTAQATLPAWVAREVDIIARLIRTPQTQVRTLRCDTSAISLFAQRVYAATQNIPAGCTVTYGELARRIDAGGAARAVGRALAANPWHVIVPCHRVIAATGQLHGFSAAGGIDTKQMLLRRENSVRDRT